MEGTLITERFVVENWQQQRLLRRLSWRSYCISVSPFVSRIYYRTSQLLMWMIH